ncbi:MAG: alpha/beta hydrolase [Bacillota bacterium]
MKLDSKPQYAPGISEFIDKVNSVYPPDSYKKDVDTQRALYSELADAFPLPDVTDVSSKDVIVPHFNIEKRMRIYTPKNIKKDGILVYIRGGGFVLGNLETHDKLVAELCSNTGLVTIAADFRMSPESKFPSALEDCYDIINYISLNKEALNLKGNIVLCGESSGANMIVSLCMLCRDRNGPFISGQALVSPLLDFHRWKHGGEDAPLLTGGEMEFYTSCYANQDELINIFVSPLINGKFHNLPPAYIMGAEVDSLLIDSVEYHNRLQENNIQSELVIEKGLTHAALRARGVSPNVHDAWVRFCKKAYDLTC